MGDIYTLERQQPSTYVDNGVPIQGYQLMIRLHRWNEVILLHVPEMDDALIDAKIREKIAQREKLEALGG